MQSDRPARVVNFLLQRVMRFPIKFNNQLAFGAKKIGDVFTNGNLPPEFMAFETRSAQRAPQDCFRYRHALSQRSREWRC